MLTQFTRDELQSFNRTQLWELCKERGLKCHPKTADCVKAILQAQPQKVADAKIVEDNGNNTQTSTKPEATEILSQPQRLSSCVDCPLFRPFNDGTGRGLCCGSDIVSREHHPLTQDCLHLIDEYNHVNDSPECHLTVGESQQFFIGEEVDEQALAQAEFNAYIEAQAEEIAPETDAVRVQRSSDIEVLERRTNNYVVRNKTNGNHYVVRPDHENPHNRCECGDCVFRGVKCKHQIAVELSPPLRHIKRARELKEDDLLVFGGKEWKVVAISFKRFNSLIWVSELHGISVSLTLLPADFEFSLYRGNSQEELVAHTYAQHERYRQALKILNPMSEAEFEVIPAPVLELAF